jgi:hypothetical protein
MRLNARALVVLFVAGAVLLTALDSIHVHTHTLVYAHPVAFGSAWWVPPLMGCAVSGGGYAYVVGWSSLGGPPKLASTAALVGAGVACAGLYAASGLLPVSSVAKLGLITLGAALIFRSVDGTRTGALLMLVSAVMGPIAEAINPGFHYVAPDFFGIPMWLPSLYACVAPVAGQLARRLVAAPEPANAGPRLASSGA